MDFLFYLLKVLILIASGVILLRISGRKSISQMTIAQTIVMISIGTIIVQPIADKNVFRAITAAAAFIVFIVLIEWLELKSNTMENIITGKAKIVIKEGNLIPENLKKLRLTVDQLEIRLRQQGISNISDVKTATLEANGQLGYELKRHAKPLTVGEFEKLMSNFMLSQNKSSQQKSNLFQEVIRAESSIKDDYINKQ